jgi:hypothetical protein
VVSVQAIANDKWNAYEANRDFKAMLWLGGVGFFASFMIGGVLTVFTIELGLPGLLVQVGVILILVFIALVGASNQYAKKHRAKVVLGIAANVSRPTSIVETARMVGLRPITFMRTLSELVSHQIIDLKFFPEVNAFGPPGSNPEDLRPTAYPAGGAFPGSASNWATLLRWISIIATILSFIATLAYLIQVFLPLLP